MTRIEWPDATHPRSAAPGSAYTLPSGGNVVVCCSALDRKAQENLRDWLTEQLEKTS